MLDKWSLLQLATGWKLGGFQCPAKMNVSQLCRRLSPRVMRELIEPLCVSALNTPAERACGQVFLRVMQDALFGIQGGSDLLLPRVDLSELFPQAAARWCAERGGQMRMGTRVQEVAQQGVQWRVNGELFDAVVFATSASEAVRALDKTKLNAVEPLAKQLHAWTAITRALQFESITAVYAWDADVALPHPMLTLRSSAAAPAQFVFDRG